MDVKKFYDTSSLLLLQEKVFDEPFYVSFISLKELENIKSSLNKDGEIKYRARNIVRLLDKYSDKYQVVMNGKETVAKLGLEPNNDSIIIGGCYELSNTEPVILYSDDLLMRLVASGLGLMICSAREELSQEEEYKGYKEIVLSDDEMANFYSNLDINQFGCLINEYLIVKDSENNIKDVRRWTGNDYIELYKKPIKSLAFGDKIRAKDIYQQMAIDSIMTNTVTIIGGLAGSGKSLLSLVCALNLIESGKYDRLVVLFNPTSARGATQMGYYGGSMIEKAMQVSIGNILTSKFGDRYAIDLMLQQNKLKLISMADCRGAEIRNDEILYISETQNTSVDLLKLCLSRASENCKIILDGDYKTQVDSHTYENGNNGMRRAIEVLRNEDIFGYVELPNVHRSKIAKLVSKM